MFRTDLFDQSGFDEVLKLTNGLTDSIPVPESIQRGEVLFYLARDLVRQYSPRGKELPRLNVDPITSSFEENTDKTSNVGEDYEFISPWESEISLTPGEWEELHYLFVTRPSHASTGIKL